MLFGSAFTHGEKRVLTHTHTRTHTRTHTHSNDQHLELVPAEVHGPNTGGKWPRAEHSGEGLNPVPRELQLTQLTFLKGIRDDGDLVVGEV